MNDNYKNLYLSLGLIQILYDLTLKQQLDLTGVFQKYYISLLQNVLIYQDMFAVYMYHHQKRLKKTQFRRIAL